MWQSLVVLSWIELCAGVFAWAHFKTYQDPSRDGLTRAVAGWYDFWVRPRSAFGENRPRAIRRIVLSQGLLAVGLGLFFLIVMAVGGFR